MASGTWGKSLKVSVTSFPLLAKELNSYLVELLLGRKEIMYVKYLGQGFAHNK